MVVIQLHKFYGYITCSSGTAPPSKAKKINKADSTSTAVIRPHISLLQSALREPGTMSWNKENAAAQANALLHALMAALNAVLLQFSWKLLGDWTFADNLAEEPGVGINQKKQAGEWLPMLSISGLDANSSFPGSSSFIAMSNSGSFWEEKQSIKTWV